MKSPEQQAVLTELHDRIIAALRAIPCGMVHPVDIVVTFADTLAFMISEHADPEDIDIITEVVVCELRDSVAHYTRKAARKWPTSQDERRMQ